MTSSKKTPDQPFANSGGLERSARRDSDPYRALDDLMAVVEALCPTWPQRDTFVTSGKMLL